MIRCEGSSIEIKGMRPYILAELGMIISAFVCEGCCDIQEILKICALASKMDKDGTYKELTKRAEIYEKKLTKTEEVKE